MRKKIVAVFLAVLVMIGLSASPAFAVGETKYCTSGAYTVQVSAQWHFYTGPNGAARVMLDSVSGWTGGTTDYYVSYINDYGSFYIGDRSVAGSATSTGFSLSGGGANALRSAHPHVQATVGRDGDGVPGCTVTIWTN